MATSTIKHSQESALLGTAKQQSAVDFNTLLNKGTYYWSSNNDVRDSQNAPTTAIGRLIVATIDNQPSLTGRWCYGWQIYISNAGNMYIRNISTNGSGVATYGAWRTINMT